MLINDVTQCHSIIDHDILQYPYQNNKSEL
jgi:hypothetical protein